MSKNADEIRFYEAYGTIPTLVTYLGRGRKRAPISEPISAIGPTLATRILVM